MTAPQRKAPLTRKTPLRRVSKKRAKLNRSVKNWREKFIAEVDRCQNPNCPLYWYEVHVHEIARGSSRHEAIKYRECCLVLCNKCNCGVFCDYKTWPLERQLALKLVTDPAHFDLALFNKVRGRAPDAITLADVAKYLEVK